jgi:ABC-type multidrug transport system fused ATPase/permease subunit
VGPSGAGKSTLLDLLAGNLAPLEGSILVDGVPATAQQLREIAAPVPQEPFLFTDSIRLNVLIGNPRATRDQIEQACAAAGVDRFARLLPGGLDAPVGKEGGLLSQGQRQRVCLARAIVSDKPLLLLDEVTSSLDGETEDHLSEALDKLAHRTIIVATHRITTARWAHETMLVDGGTVRPVGGKGRPGAQDNRLVALFGAQWSKETNGE